nr:ATP-binding protein [Roseibium hamelinense]
MISFGLLGFVFIGIFAKVLWDRELDQATTTTEALFLSAKEPLERAVWSINEESALQIVQGLLSLKAVESVWVETPDTGTYGVKSEIQNKNVIKYDLVSPAIYANSDKIGSVYFIIDRSVIYDQVVSVVTTTVLSIVIYLVMLGVILRAIFRRLIGIPLSSIVTYLQTPRLIEDPPRGELMPGRTDEIGILASSLQTMVGKRHADLKQIQDYQMNLEDLVTERTEQLKKVQEELIQADNLAALGALVAGVSHELNTPLGNGLIAATTITESTGHLKDKIQAEELTLDDLNAEISRIGDASNVIEKTLGRARELVQNFRQVAVDRQSEKRREFNVDHIIRETLATLQPSLKKTPYTVKLHLHANTVIDSYPGAVSQIITNLVENAVKHAYEDETNGVVEIETQVAASGHTTVTCKDYGCGIPEGHLKRLFEPFFTTKLGKGGSGLGMAIVYRLVTEVLGGQISVVSEVGTGTTFTIDLPPAVPASKTAA